jgi:hypothetical protein
MSNPDDETSIGGAVRSGFREGVRKVVATAVASVGLGLLALAVSGKTPSSASPSPSESDLSWRQEVGVTFKTTERNARLIEQVSIGGIPVAVYRESGEIRKLVVAGEALESDFYFTGGKLAFVYEHRYDVPDGLNADPTMGDRYYFRTNSFSLSDAPHLFHWTAPGRLHITSGSEFEARGRRLMERADALMAALQSR